MTSKQTIFEKEIYQKFYPLVRSTCYGRLTDKGYLEDAVQSVFLLFIKEDADQKKILASWFYWASVNVC